MMRRLPALVVLLALLPGLGACGFSPLYGDGPRGGAEAQLTAMEIAPQTTRTGQLIRNAMLEGIAPARAGGGRYRLSFTAKESVGTKRLVLDVDYVLSDRQTGKVLTTGKTFADISYAETRQPVADIQAQKNAREAAARVVARDIRTRLAAWLAAHGRA